MPRWLLGIALSVALAAPRAHAAMVAPEPRSPTCGPFGPDCPRAKKRLNLWRVLTDRSEVLELVELLGGEDARELAEQWARGDWRLDLGRQRVYVEVRGTLPSL